MTTVLGRKVQGEITRWAEKREKDQWPGEKFLEFLDSILALDEVEAVRWRQYTPYFNDGDPCVFSVKEPRVKLVDSPPAEDEDEDDYYGGFVDTFGMLDHNGGVLGDRPTRSGYEKVLPLLQVLEDNMDHFEEFLEESFGDHAIVTATRDGFDVEFYEHE